MAYSSLGQRDQTYNWNPAPPYNDPNAFELKPKEPSISSAEPSLVGQAGPAHGDASSDYQHLLQPQSGPLVGSRWEPGFWRQLPAFGILSLVGVLVSTLAALVILIKSHRQPLNAWGYGVAPSVYLAIASVIANASSAYALANGLEIAFWRNALKGRTLAELNQNWLNGQNLWHAVLQGYRVGGRITALACVFSVLALLRGPLNQRASEVQSDIAYDTSGAFTLSVAQVLPDNYTGIARHSRARIQEIARLTPGFAQIMQEHSMRTNITIEHKECGVSCSATVKGFGFKTQCRTQEFISEIATNEASTQTIFESSTDLYPITNVSTNSYNYDNMGMRLNVTYRVNLTDADETSTPKNRMRTRLRSHICDLTGATVEYDVQVNSQTISRVRERFVKDLVMPGPGTNFHDSTIGGFEYVANYLFTSKAVFNFAGAVSSTSLTGALANEMVQGNTWGETFSDPMDSMIDTMQQIAFRTAVRAGKDIANSTDAKQQVQYRGSGRRSIYVTDFRYMATAFAISIASVFAVSLTFYGWWELGRIVSLSPLEIAKAFDAPLLANVGSNLDLSNNKNLGPAAAVMVRYGENANEEVYTTGYSGATVDTQIRKLVMGVAGQVRRPNSRENYGT